MIRTRSKFKASIIIVLLMSMMLLGLMACSEQAPDEIVYQSEESEPYSPPSTPNESARSTNIEPSPNAPDTGSSSDSDSNVTQDLSSFDIRGTWKSVGDYGFGQAQPGAVIRFSDGECNLYSPRDTYAIYEDGGNIKLDATGLLGGTSSFRVVIVNNDNIELHTGSNVTLLRRVG
jgi:hypothetical protein